MIKLSHFTPAEFGEWWPMMSPLLLKALDEFRGRLRSPVMISPANGALGRHWGDGSASMHNVDHWGQVMAADIMLPRGPDLIDPSQGRRVVDMALQSGFGGIGVYLGWRPYPGLHLDVRARQWDGSAATWSRLGDEYRAIDDAWGVA